MTMALSTHLSEEAINDVLIGLGTVEAEAHLAVCVVCRRQVESARSNIQAFNAATLAQSEHRAVHIQAASARSWYRKQSLLQYGLAAAAALLLAISLPVEYLGRFATHIAPPSVAVESESEDSEPQIAQDNELLRSVDAALSTSEASPVNDYHLIIAARPGHGAHSGTRK